MEGEEEVEEGDPRLLDEWERLEVEAEEVEIQNYTMVETLTARHVSEVKSCLARMVARLKYLGLDVRRVHSDAAGEMRGQRSGVRIVASIEPSLVGAIGKQMEEQKRRSG